MRPADAKRGWPVCAVRGAIHVVVIDPVEAYVQVIQDSGTEEMIPTYSIIIRDERMMKRSAVDGRRKIW